MEIRKRNGEMAAFNAEKIRAAMRLDECGDHGAIAEQPFAGSVEATGRSAAIDGRECAGSGRAAVDGGGILRDCKGIHPVQGKAGEGSRDTGADCSAHGRSFVGGNIA